MIARHLFHRGFARAAARRAPLAATLAILAGLSCSDDLAGPRIPPSAQFSFAPRFSSSAALVVDFERVRIVFTRAGTDAIAFDTIVSFPSDADSITLSLAVPVQGVGQSENLSFRLAMINAAGDTVFRGGPNSVTLTAGAATAPVLVPIRYTGVGANAAAVRIAARDTSVFFNDSIVLTAVAFDSANQPISGTPIEWTSLDTARALVPLPNTGKVFGRAQRGPARIRARLITGQADTSIVRVQPVPSALALLAGNGQSGTVGATLAQPLAVRVTAADGLGVVGVRVRFTVVSGGGTVDTLVVTDTAGVAAAQLRLGTLAGPDTVRAAVTGLAGSPVTFVAAAVPGAAKTLAIAVQPGTTPAGSPIAPAVQVAARDTFGNVATAFTGTVTLAIGTNPASGTLSGTTAVAAVAGIATFSAISINRPGTGYTLTATATGLTGAATAAFNITVGAPSLLVFSVQPSGATAGAAIAPAVVVAAQDSFGNLAPAFTDSVVLSLGANPGGATLSGTVRVAAVGGVATFPGVVLDRTGTGYTLSAASGTLTGATSAAFNVAAAAPATLVFTTQPTDAAAGAAISPAVVVAVRDALGNLNTGYTDTVAVILAANPGGATLSGATRVAAVAGIATFTGLSLDRAASGYTLGATSGALTGATSAAFAVTPAAATALAFTTQPTTVMASHSIPMAPPVVVAVQDQYGNTVTSYNDSVFVSVSFGRAPLGATRVLAANGVATFGNLRLDSVGTGYYLRATTPTVLTPVNSATFDVTPGIPMAIALSSGNGQAGAVNTALAAPLVVAVQDSFGNVVPAVTVTWTVTSGGGSVPATSVTNTLGRAQATWTLGALLGTQTAEATIAGLTGSPVAFTASATPVGTTAMWTGSASTTWSDGANWSGGAAPLATDTVFVPASASLQPSITANTTVGGLIVQNGATLTIDTLVSLIVFGPADASYTSVGGPGSVLLAGTGTVRGHFRSLTVQGAFAIRDSLLVTDSLMIIGATANLAGNGGYARIGGDLFVAGDGTLSMAAGDSIEVLGSATFAGGSTSGRLTGGVLRVAQDFSQIAATSPESFVATSNHRLVLNGAAPQTVTMMTSGNAGPSNIGDLIIANTADTVDIGEPTRIADRFEIQTGAHVVASDTVRLTGSFDGLRLAAGGSFAGPTLLLTGPTVIDPAARYQARNSVFVGSGGVQDIPALTYDSATASGYDTLTVIGPARFTGPTTLAGELLVSGGGEAQLAGQHVQVQGRLVVGDTADAGTRSGGQLRMDQPGDSLVVYGDVYFGGGPTTAGYLSSGVLDVKGNFRQLARGGTTNNFVTGGAFTTVFDGPGGDFPQYVRQENPGSSPFRHIVGRTGGSGLSLATNIMATGNVSVPTGATITQAAPFVFEIGGNVTSTGYLDLDALHVAGVLNADATEGAYNVQRTVFSGTGQTVPDSLPYRYLAVGLNGTAAFTAGMVRTVDSLVVGGQLDVNGAKITTGHFETNSPTGVLVMDAAGDSLAVTSAARFLGGPSVLTAGTLHLTGGALVENGTGTTQAFAASVGHTTILASSATVSFANPGTAASHLGGVQIPFGNSATLLTPAVAAGRVSLSAYAGLSGPRLLVLDSVFVGTNGSLIPAVLEVAGGFGTLEGTLSPTDTLILRGTDGIPDTVTGWWNIPNLVVAGTDSVIDISETTIDGSLFVRGGVYLADGVTTVVDSLVVTGTGVVAMSNGDASLTVARNARFAGAPTADHLSSGNLFFRGNFRQEGDPQSFRPTGVSVFTNGTAPQVFSFESPGATSSRFAEFYAGSEVRFASDVYVGGTMVVYSNTVDDTLGSWTATLAGGITDYNTSVAGWRVANTILTSSMLLMPAVMNTNLFVRSSLLAEYYTVDGNVTVEAGGVLDAGYGTVQVSGNVTVESGGVLDPGYGTVWMDGSLATTGTGLVRQSSGSIQVGQDASFAGASDLTGGTLEIVGNFTQLGTTSFQAAVGHTTRFTMPYPYTQTVSFAAPDTTFAGLGSHFGNMEMGVSNGTIELLTDAAVQGTFQSGDISNPTLTGAHRLYTRGLNQYGLTMDGTMLTLVDGEAVNFGNTTFRNQPGTATRFWIRRSDFYLMFLDFTFEGTPEPGGYYVGVQNLSGSGQTVNFWFVDPAGQPLYQALDSPAPTPTVCWTAGSSCGPF